MKHHPQPATDEHVFGDSPIQERWRQRHPRRQIRRAAPRANIAPMIDMTFLFFIYFIATTSFARTEGLFTSNMPKEQGRTGIALPISPIIVRLTPGNTDEECNIQLDHIAFVPTNFAELTEVLVQLHEKPGFDQDTPVVIMANDDLAWNHVVSGWNAALRAGCRRVAFGTRKEQIPATVP